VDNEERKWRAVVLGSLFSGTISIHVAYGYGLANGGGLWRFSQHEVPINCRFPNTYLWITVSNHKVVKIESMTEKEIEENPCESLKFG
jgi:hypothetical protein